MPREALADESVRRARERYPGTKDIASQWAYQAAYQALEDRLRKARSRGVLPAGGHAEKSYWQQVALIAAEKMEEVS